MTEQRVIELESLVKGYERELEEHDEWTKGEIVKYEQRIAELKQLVREMHAEILSESTMVDKDGNERVIPWAKPTLDNFEARMKQLGIGDAE